MSLLFGTVDKGENLTSRGCSLKDFSGATLRNAKMRNCNFRHSQAQKADMREANLIEAKLADVDMTGCILVDATLMNADLRGAILNEADLTYANLFNAKMAQSAFGPRIQQLCLSAKCQRRRFKKYPRYFPKDS